MRAIKVVGDLDTGDARRDGEKLRLFDLRRNIQRDLIPTNKSLPFQRGFGTRRIDTQA